MNLRKTLSYCRRAADDYGMISDGDRIAVGLSGGKDSMTLLCALAGLRLFYPAKFTLCAVTVDMGFPGADFSPAAELCNRFDVEYKIIKTQIAEVVFDIRKEKNPCSLCAKMRRGALHDAVITLGCNKVALGHHFDDAVETFMLNLFYEGRVGCFSPVTYLDRTGLWQIRPLLYMPEKEIKYWAAKNDFPVIHNPCPANKYTKREDVKKLLRQLDCENPGLRERIFGAMKRGNIDGF